MSSGAGQNHSGRKKGKMNRLTRISKDEYYLKIAEAVLLRSTCLRRRYGAVIVKNDEILATGYNGAPRGEVNCIDVGVCEREKLNVPKGERYELCLAVHAEQNALISAARRDIIGGTIYIVGIDVKSNTYADPQPCLICRRMLKNAGIARAVGYVNGEVKELEI
jgi:dCMP deaminase